MKKVKILFGSALMLLAVAGAFASSKALVDPVFYLDATNNCVAGEVEEACILIGSPDCELPILGTAIVAQTFATQTPVSGQPGRFTCSDPYERETK